MAQLYFKYGAMGSSKTANALMTRFNYEERGQQTLLAPTLMKLFGVPIHLYPNQCEHPEAACNKCGALCHALRMAPAGREDKGQRHA